MVLDYLGSSDAEVEGFESRVDGKTNELSCAVL